MQKLLRENNYKLLLLLALTSTIFYFGCTKIDTTPNNIEIVNFNNAATEKFFSLPQNASTAMLRVAAEMKNRNLKEEFVTTFVKNNGYPIWDKVIENKTELANNFNSFTSVVGADTIFILPIVPSGANYVSSFIYAKLNGTVTLDLYRGGDYSLYSFNNVPTDSINADKAAVQIMVLNKLVFGYTKFIINDSRIFSPTNATTNQQGRFATVLGSNTTNCTTCIYWVCSVCGGTGANCPQPGLHTSCFQGFCVGGTNNGTGGIFTGPGNPTTGGGPEPPPTPFPCPSSQNRSTDPPVCSPSPIPPVLPWDTVNVVNPCDTLNKYAQSPYFQALFQNLKQEIPTRHENMYIFKDLINPPANSIIPVVGNNNEFGVFPPDTSIFKNSWGWFHNHFASDSAGLNFSAGDVNEFAQQLVRNSTYYQIDYTHFMVGVTCDSNANYILMVENINNFTNWANSSNHNNYEMMEILFGAAGLNQEALPISVTETEKRFLNILNFSGLKLFRGSADFTTWTPIKLNAEGTAVITAPCQ
jgi:hypothetical protein